MSSTLHTATLADGTEYTYSVPDVIHPWNQSDGLTYARGTDHKFSARAEQYYGQALWYAWGMHDSGAYGDTLTLDDGWRFAAITMDAAEHFERQSSYFLRSILDMWADYCRLIGARRA